MACCSLARAGGAPALHPKGEDHAELQLELLPAPSTAAGGDGHSSPRVLPFAPCFAKGTLCTARGPKDQFVATIIWESKLRCTGALQRAPSSTASTMDGTFPKQRWNKEVGCCLGVWKNSPVALANQRAISNPIFQPGNMGWTHQQQLSPRDGEGAGRPVLVSALSASPRAWLVRSLQPRSIGTPQEFSRGVEGIWVQGYVQPTARKAMGAADRARQDRFRGRAVPAFEPLWMKNAAHGRPDHPAKESLDHGSWEEA